MPARSAHAAAARQAGRGRGARGSGHIVRAMPDLGPAVATIVRQCLQIAPGETVIVVADESTRTIGEALRAEAAEAGADAVMALMDERAEDGTEPPVAVAAALAASQVFIAPTSRSLSHTTRAQARQRGGRARRDDARRHRGDARPRHGGRLRAHGEALAGGGRSADQRAPCGESPARAGTDLTLELDGRAGISDDGKLTESGAFGNLPCGEAFIAPTCGEGVIAAASLAPLGLSEEPATLTVRDGADRLRRGRPRRRVLRPPRRPRRGRAQPGRARGGDQRRRAADRQHARGREDPRHRAHRLRRQRRHRRHGLGAHPPRRRRARCHPGARRRARCSTPGATSWTEPATSP